MIDSSTRASHVWTELQASIIQFKWKMRILTFLRASMYFKKYFLILYMKEDGDFLNNKNHDFFLTLLIFLRDIFINLFRCYFIL